MFHSQTVHPSEYNVANGRMDAGAGTSTRLGVGHYCWDRGVSGRRDRTGCAASTEKPETASVGVSSPIRQETKTPTKQKGRAKCAALMAVVPDGKDYAATESEPLSVPQIAADADGIEVWSFRVAVTRNQ